ncbi:MAG: GTPase HflX [Lentisphaerota bacterium]
MDLHLLHSEGERERALLVGVIQQGRRAADVADSLDELAQLADTAGADVLKRVVCKQGSPHAATYIGKGKVMEIAAQITELGITTVIFDDDLSPGQGRNLEELMPAKIIDRTQMILDIFAKHAHTKEGALQIELAQLQYLLPRLKRMWTHLERQKGGIGLRGPGEMQLEVDRRRIEEKIVRLRKELEHVRERRAEQRRGRRRHGWALLTLVGYTNAGKSTLLNALTGASVMAEDQLFATLDPTTRKLDLPNKQSALITDTVGFIRKLPHHLVESFKATLEEVLEADLLIHVIDASHPKVHDQIAAVEVVLRELGAQSKPVVLALNKMDQERAKGQAASLFDPLRRVVKVSALTGEGLKDLCHEVADCLKDRNIQVKLHVPQSEGQLLSLIRSQAQVFHQEYEQDLILIEAAIPGKIYSRCKAFLVEDDAEHKQEAQQGEPGSGEHDGEKRE